MRRIFCHAVYSRLYTAMFLHDDRRADRRNDQRIYSWVDKTPENVKNYPAPGID